MKFTYPAPHVSNSLHKPWKNCIAVGHAAELLREDVLAQLEIAQKAVGWRYLRFHAVFSDQMNCVSRAEDGSLRFQWNHLDKVYDRILGMGLKPFVELNPMPTVLASTKKTIFAFEMNVSPPTDYSEWAQLVEAFTRHCVDRYGLAEVRSWYFEVWNEPNLPGFWGGSQEDYWKLYETSARAVKGVDPHLRIGGPASAAAAWVGELIEHCHIRGVPLDFVSTHRYPQDEYSAQPDSSLHSHARGHFFGDEVKRIHALVRASVMPDLEIHWTEWNSQSASDEFPVTWSANRFVDSSFAGSFIVKHCLELDEFSDSFAWWVVSDIFEEPGFQQAPFSCTYGLITVDGIPKSSFHAFRFLAKLRGASLSMESGDPPPEGCGIHACEEAGVIRGLAWNHPPLEATEKPVWRTEMDLPWEERGEPALTTAVVKPGAGSAWESWTVMGRPHTISESERDLLRAHAEPEWRALRPPQSEGRVRFALKLEPYTFLYFECRSAAARAHGKGVSIDADLAILEDQLMV